MRLAELPALADRERVTFNLSSSEPCTGTGVREVLASVIDNIVNNALKQSEAEQGVLIELRRDHGQSGVGLGLVVLLSLPLTTTSGDNG